NMVSPLEISEADIPYCPVCGAHLIPNLRCDYNFVEKPHMTNAKAYENFLNTASGKKLVLLELGVGYNTPGIIRFPFDSIAQKNANASLIRINDTQPDIPKGAEESSVGIQADIGKALSDIRSLS
ncbi:MAG: NAD-dependent protein deacetylase, SIR2 family, partial [Oscillospiraceae bacterium]